MLYRSERLIESLKRWEKQVLKLSDYAEVQRSDKRVLIYQVIYNIQSDIYKLKSLIDSLKKSPWQKTELKESLIHEMFKKIDQKIENEKYFKELSFNTVRFTEKKISKKIKKQSRGRYKELDSLKAESIEPLIKEIDYIIKAVEVSLNSYTQWSINSLVNENTSFKRDFSKRLNKLQYYKDKTESWLLELKNESADNFDKVKKNLLKTYRSLLKAWGRLREIHEIEGVSK